MRRRTNRVRNRSLKSKSNVRKNKSRKIRKIRVNRSLRKKTQKRNVKKNSRRTRKIRRTRRTRNKRVMVGGVNSLEFMTTHTGTEMLLSESITPQELSKMSSETLLSNSISSILRVPRTTYISACEILGMNIEDIKRQVEEYDNQGVESNDLAFEAYIISYFRVLVKKKKKQENPPIAEGTPPPRADEVDVGDVSLNFGV